MTRRLTWMDAALLITLALAVGWVVRSRPGRERSKGAVSVPAGKESLPPGPPASEPAGSGAEWAIPPAPEPEALALTPEEPGKGGADPISEDDRRNLERLHRLVMQRADVAPADLFAAEELSRRYPGVPSVAATARAVLSRAADNEWRSGRDAEAVRILERLAELWPESPAGWHQLIAGHLSRERWRDAELACRRALSAHPSDPAFHQMLSVALLRQDRHQEAADALRRALAQREDAGLRATLERIEAGLAHEKGMARRGSTHFTVQLEGGASDSRARDVVDLLERRYLELSRVLEYEPAAEIPVVLYPTDEGVRVSGAPAWASATYSHFDGRIRVGTADLSAGITPDLDETLTHELVHAFVAGRTGGNVPRPLNEGLAQYLSGRRPRPVVIVTASLTQPGHGSVHDFYEAALSFVDYLIRRYGQSDMNALLAALGRNGMDAAARRVYGRTHDELVQDWIKQLP